jgi:hypothetical protein
MNFSLFRRFLLDSTLEKSECNDATGVGGYEPGGTAIKVRMMVRYISNPDNS